MKTLRILPILLLTFYVSVSYSQTSDQPPTIYTVVDYIKVKPGMGGDYIKLEEAWMKIHKKRMEKDELLNWGVYNVATNNGTLDEYEYAVVSLYRGHKQLAGYYGEHDINEYADVLTKEDLALVQRTAQIRDVVREDVYLFMHQTAEAPFPQVQWLQSLKLNKDHSLSDFMKIEKQLGDHIDGALIKEGALLNKQIYSRAVPSGTSSEFDIVRTFAFNDVEHMLNFPAKNGEIRAKLNPGYAGLGAQFGTVDLVNAEMWIKVMCACDK